MDPTPAPPPMPEQYEYDRWPDPIRDMLVALNGLFNAADNPRTSPIDAVEIKKITHQLSHLIMSILDKRMPQKPHTQVPS